MNPSTSVLAIATCAGISSYLLAALFGLWHEWQQARAQRRFRADSRTPPAATIDALYRRLRARNIARLAAIGATATTFVAGAVLTPGPLLLATPIEKIGTIAMVLLTAALLTLVIRDARRTAQLGIASAARHAVTHALLRVGADHLRLHHDVPVDSEHWVDHVMLNVNGVFAVHVITPPGGRTTQATVTNDCINFSGQARPVHLADVRQRSAALQHAISKPLGRVIPVRSVIVVAGCQVLAKNDEQLLIVSESDLVMIQGWRCARAALMTEDVHAIDGHLISIATPRRTLPAILGNALLSASV